MIKSTVEVMKEDIYTIMDRVFPNMNFTAHANLHFLPE